MRVCVAGLWHLGCVISACLAKAGHEVVGIDADAETVANLRRGKPPLFEPGLEDLVAAGLARGTLRFDTEPRAAAGAEVVWIAYDTPVDDNDVPQPAAVVDRVMELLPHVTKGALVLLSSQLPVGTTRQLANAAGPGRAVTFGYSPENLRLGRAIEVFTRPDRVIVGLQADADRAKVSALLAPFTDKIVWTGIEAAEMTKHAINAFLATSVAFMNEIAAICEQVGADASEVERGLKSEERIGPKAYLSPGGAFAGGTLARDVTTLAGLGERLGMPVTLISAVRESNDRHRSWPLRKLRERLGGLGGRRIAILGLTYKPGTSTLRRSGAVELAMALKAEGASVVAFDPAVRDVPSEIASGLTVALSPQEALKGADAAVLATPWPEFRDLPWPELLPAMRSAIVVDANGFLAASLRNRPGIAYAAVGLPWSAE
jgi:UDPglucose 6-dehydrogenase